MKMAILIYGRINTSLESYQNMLSHIVQGHDADFFIVCEKNTDDDVMRGVYKLYNPKVMFKSDENVKIDITKYKSFPETNRMNTMYMFLSQLKLKQIVNEYIRNTGTNYNMLITTRMDMILNDLINLGKLMPYVNKGILSIPNQDMDHRGGICGCFAIGDLNAISIYLSVYNSIYNLLESDVILHPEFLIACHLKSSYIEVYRFIMKCSRIVFKDDAISFAEFSKVMLESKDMMDPRFVRFRQATKKPSIKLII